ncbi:CPG4 domain-containing protein [Aphelenchoides bicaudatus]|nr:CPG4 domain-containing protein [Aphelenchoides bicaudatus]
MSSNNKSSNNKSSNSKSFNYKGTIMLRAFAFTLLFFHQTGYSFPDDCTDNCVSQMQMASQMIETIPPTNSTTWNFQQRAFINKTPMNRPADSASSGDNVVNMQNFFTTVCQSYETVEKCLEKCGGNSKQLLMIKQTYAGLKLICKDHRKEFFSALPCLTRFEPMAMSKCNQEIYQSHITTANFTEAILNREFYSIRLKFRFLCRDLTAMIHCMEPIVRQGCGDRSTNLMLHFITLEFSSFEQLYGQLAFNEPLPHHCRSLLTLSAGRNNLFTQKSYTLTYPQNSSNYIHLSSFLLIFILLAEFVCCLVINN